MKASNKYPLAVLITDTHLHKNNVELVKDIFKQVIEVCHENRIEQIYHLADFFTSREAQPLNVLKEAKEIFKDIEEANLFMNIFPGNHDKTDLESEISYIDVVEKNDNIKVFTKESCESLDDINFIYLPYFKEKGSYIDRLNNASKLIEKDKKNILLTHIGINGVTNNDGSAVENEVKQELFKKFFKVFCGHYHDQQSKANIFYIGSAYQANFGEDDKKGFTILYSDGSHEFIQSKFPKYIKEKINIEQKDALKKFEKKYANSTDHVRIILTGNKEKLQSFKKENFIDKGIDIKFESEEININTDISNQEIQIYDRSNIQVAFNKFTDLNSIDEEDKKFGQPYLEKIL